LNDYVIAKNPDIILGHNILGYDLPYLDKNSFPGLFWGKDKSRIIFDEKASKKRKDGSQQYEYFNAYFNGREIVDTFFLSLTYDIGREFPSYGLKSIEKHLGLVKDDRSWDFKTWPVRKLIEAKKAGNHEIWNQFRQYCADDSDSPIKMFDIMIPSFFYLCQSVPKTLQQMVNEASGSQLDSLMIRSYLQDGYSLPRSSKKEEFEGAISMGVPGVYKNVRKVDVASLYPSIMLQYEIYDKKKDPNCHQLKMLKYFRDERLTNKRLAKETGDKYYDDLQNSQKIMINSMYGFMGAGYLLFNYPFGAAEVTRYGREILLKGVEWSTGHTLVKVVKSTRNEGTEDAEEKFHWIVGDKVGPGLGYKLVNVDTDSFSYTNDLLPTKEEFDAELKALNALYPKLISWEKDGKDGIFDKIIVV
jgi:DNA polymerase elongation subunit (family B)